MTVCTSIRSRVISAHSWYLTSFVYPLFHQSAFCPSVSRFKHSTHFFSKNTICLFSFDLLTKGENRLDLFSHTAHQTPRSLPRKLLRIYLHALHRRVEFFLPKLPYHSNSPRLTLGFVIPLRLQKRSVVYLPIGPYLLCTYSIAYFFGFCNWQNAKSFQYFFV